MKVTTGELRLEGSSAGHPVPPPAQSWANVTSPLRALSIKFCPLWRLRSPRLLSWSSSMLAGKKKSSFHPEFPMLQGAGSCPFWRHPLQLLSSQRVTAKRGIGRRELLKHEFSSCAYKEGPRDVSSRPVPARKAPWDQSIAVGWEPAFFKQELQTVPSTEVPQEE